MAAINNGHSLNKDLTNHLHFSTLQLSEVKKDGSFLDEAKSPNNLFSACTTENNLLSRSKSHHKRPSADWTSNKKGETLVAKVLK